MKCSNCGGSCRTRQRAIIQDGSGVGRAGLVCSKCAGAGVTIVAPPAEAAAKCSCGSAAKVCSKCSEKRAARPSDMQKQIAAKLRKLATAYRRAPDDANQEHQDGRVAGLLQAADLAQGWAP